MRRAVNVGRWIAVVTVMVVAMVAWQRRAWARPQDTFEGKWKCHFTTEEVGQGAEKSFDDVLTFAAGNLTSETMKKKGFDATPYDLDTRGYSIMAFTADGKSGGEEFDEEGDGGDKFGRCDAREEDRGAQAQGHGEEQGKGGADGGAVDHWKRAECGRDFFGDGFAVFNDDFAVGGALGDFELVGPPVGGGEEFWAKGLNGGKRREGEDGEKSQEHHQDGGGAGAGEVGEEAFSWKNATKNYPDLNRSQLQIRPRFHSGLNQSMTTQKATVPK